MDVIGQIMSIFSLMISLAILWFVASFFMGPNRMKRLSKRILGSGYAVVEAHRELRDKAATITVRRQTKRQANQETGEGASEVAAPVPRVEPEPNWTWNGPAMDWRAYNTPAVTRRRGPTSGTEPAPAPVSTEQPPMPPLPEDDAAGDYHPLH